MIRLFTAAALLVAAAAPAFACDWNKSASTDTSQPSTVASQPADQQAAPPASTTTTQSPT